MPPYRPRSTTNDLKEIVDFTGRIRSRLVGGGLSRYPSYREASS
jgi:hypothetical protein